MRIDAYLILFSSECQCVKLAATGKMADTCRMYVSLPLGPMTLPTAPLLAIVAALLCLEVAARAGRRFGLRPDDVWNTGLIAIVAGLIVARLWNVIQFGDIYRNDPWLIISPRPSGFAFLPGLIGGVIAGYINMIRKALDPLRVATAFALGLAAAGVVTSLSNYLTGAVVGNPSLGAFAVRYFYEMVQPVALYRMAILAMVALVVWLTLLPERPARTLWIVLLGYGLMLVTTGNMVRDPELLLGVRREQGVGLLLAVGASIALALEARRNAQSASAYRTPPASPPAGGTPLALPASPPSQDAEV
jgi:prolipoprotein diacylglyceryltransferase